MPKLNDEWTVLPHGPVRTLAPGLKTVVGQIPLPLGNFPRRMTALALSGGRSLLFSPIPLHEDQMAEIEALGAPAFLVVPNHGHRLDIRAFKDRYPDAKVITAPGSVERVREAVSVDGTSADLGPAGELICVAGVEEMELALLVHHDGGSSLVINDIVGNVRQPQGPGAWIMSRLTGFGPTPRVPRYVRRAYVKDPSALAAQLAGWARIKSLVRLVPSHGDIIDHPAPVLERIAQSLGRGSHATMDR